MPDAEGDPTEFVMERTFAAPPETVWRAWTDPALLARWYKPDPSCETAVLQHELHPGGVLRYEMRFRGMPPHYERWEFEAIVPPARLPGCGSPGDRRSQNKTPLCCLEAREAKNRAAHRRR